MDALITTFKSFFSRSFWLGSFLPVLVVGFLHALLAAIAFERPWASFEVALKVDAEQGMRLALLAAALIVIAYVLTPFATLFRGLLDGSLLPAPIYQALRDRRRGAWRSAVDDFREARDKARLAERLDERRMELPSIRRAFADSLAAARATVAGPPAGAPPSPQQVAAAQAKVAAAEDAAKAKAAIRAAEAAVTALTKPGLISPDNLPERFRERWRRRTERVVEDLKLFDAAEQALRAALGAHSAGTGERGILGDLAVRLGNAHVRFDALMRERSQEERYRFEAAARRNAGLDLRGWQATRLAEERHATETYSMNAYGADYDWLWPRLALALPEEDKAETIRIRDADAQVNFGVLLVVLFQTVPVVWLPLLFFRHQLGLFLLVGWLAPVVTAGLYELAVRSLRGFGSAVETAIDGHRFALLTILHQPLPATLSAERALWKKLSRASLPAYRVELIYERRAPPA